MGCGGDKKQKVVWVAVRIPDGMISGHANQARIGQFSTYNTDVMTSKNCIKFAREKGWFTGNDKDFNWKMVYAAPDFGGRRLLRCTRVELLQPLQGYVSLLALALG